MRFGVERDVLADAVGWTARTLPARPPVPVLAGVLLEAAEPGVLKLSSFDYEVSAHVEVEAEVHEPGRVLVSGRLLADIARSLPAKQRVQVYQQGPRVILVCGSSRFTLLTMPVEDYPALPAMPATVGSVAGDVFAAAVAQVVVAASRDETLPVLTGVRVEIDGDEVTLLATDRYRLAVRTLPWSAGDGSTTATALVRARTLSEVARSMGSGDVVLALSPEAGAEGGRPRSSSGLVGFEAGERRTTSLLVDGDYPKVRSLFPPESPTSAVVEVGKLVEAVRRVALVAERSRPVRLSFTQGQVVLEAGDGEDAQASEAIDARLDGDDISIAFNPQFLLDGLGALDVPFVRLSFTLPTKPAVLTGQTDVDGEPDDRYRYLLMPVRMAG